MESLNTRKLALSLGIVSALGAFLLGITSSLWGWGSAIVSVASSLYIGYDSTFLGAVIGAVWAFIDGFIGGWLIAWVYNRV
ncbi:hypothetical protein CO038_00265 [Candidatus Pacearchaeota archaeon CG_4_9_14_0_2_um_filter_39_13]|nr:hypothetical protein [Candidatus Pacearchaeota archaeon]OIO44026.1 MAG: hypothetical protein AUJ64_00990 [Candidatus Pacearchaeota archaeon CG1_02_39_14]PJC45108.1 MAG: hypothetical protein CO038_00265 [Candidatus Pacearchaeota archaeon CG_4_9_14_0_2_um_filter_39_13]